MILRGLATLATLVSVPLFPWPVTASLALGMSLFEPLVPLAVGLFADILYYTPHAARVPLFTICGAAVTIGAFFVRSRLLTGIIGE